MFVSHAKIRIVGLGGKSRKRRPHRRRLAIREVVRMPCLLPTTVTVFLGLLAVSGGAGMAVIGYIPSSEQNLTTVPNSGGGAGGGGAGGGGGGGAPAAATAAAGGGRGSGVNGSLVGYSNSGQGSNDSELPGGTNSPSHDATFYLLKTCSYLGPVIMAIGLFAMIVAGVFYCEILDKYAILVPDRKSATQGKDELYEVIVGEMKKSYAQTLVTAYTKAAERCLIADSNSTSMDLNADTGFPYNPSEPLTLEQQIDIECEGYTPSPPIPNKRYSVIQARIQRLRSEDAWLKTSSLPNIRRSDHSSIKRVGRMREKLKAITNQSLSCDYTMDEARLRRKSMMLRSIILGNSCSSGDLQQKQNRQRRFSSTKFLPSEKTFSFDEMSHNVGFAGSFPMTRLIQRRGTFACGDMRTRRMKFLLLLQASESQELVTDNASMDGRHTVTGIRRNSFIPYNTCDKFIAKEEKKTARDRRMSINPFSFGNRFGNTIPQPGTRRHSFYPPVRREDKIYASDCEKRRHSFNPIGIHNVQNKPLRPDQMARIDIRRKSFLDSLQNKDAERRGSYIPPQKTSSNFLSVPGLEHEQLFMERRPSASSEGAPPPPAFSQHDSSSLSSHSFHGDTRVERRHSYNPVVRLPSPGAEGTSSNGQKVPTITINEETGGSGRYLMVPEFNPDERRHSFNTMSSTSKQHIFPTAAASSSKLPEKSEKSSSQRISFKLEPEEVPSTPSSSSAFLSVGGKAASTGKTSIKPSSRSVLSTSVVRPSGFNQEIVVFKPLPYTSDSKSPGSSTSASSEKTGSERAVKSPKASPVIERRTKRPSSPVKAPVPAGHSYGTFEVTSSTAGAERLHTKPKTKSVISPGLPGKMEVNVPHKMDVNVSLESGHPSEKPIRKSASFNLRRDGKGEHGQFRPIISRKDSPASTHSGPATLSPSIKTVTFPSSAIHRSKSSSALPPPSRGM